MAAIQVTEPHAVGPKGANDDTLRNQMLSYANVDLNTCGLDQSVTQQSDADLHYRIAQVINEALVLLSICSTTRHLPTRVRLK